METDLRIRQVCCLMMALSIVGVEITSGMTREGFLPEARSAYQTGVALRLTQTGAPAKGGGQASQKPQSQEKKPPESPAADHRTKDAGDTSSADAERVALSMLSAILASAERMNDVESAILVRVEAASVLWDKDRERARSLLRSSFDMMKTSFATQKTVETRNSAKEETEEFRRAVLRRIVRLDPRLLQELRAGSSGVETTDGITVGVYEALDAMIAVAYELLDENPARAGTLSQEILNFGVSFQPNFFRELGLRNRALAEAQLMEVFRRVRDMPITPLYFVNFQVFVFAKESSPQLKESFFESLAIRLRHDLRPDFDLRAVESAFRACRAGESIARQYDPRWEGAFVEIDNNFLALLATRSLSTPVPSPPRMALAPPPMVEQGDTESIAKSASGVRSISDQKTRDQQYASLAEQAALKADALLAEDMLAKIEDERTRREANLAVYSPLAMKASYDADWERAREYSLKIVDPLGKSLVVDWVAKRMVRSGQDRELVREFYDAAASGIQRQPSSLNSARGLIILARSLLPFDREKSFTIMGWAVTSLGRVGEIRPFAKEQNVPYSLWMWVSQAVPDPRPPQILDLTELVGPVFTELSKRDYKEAQNLAIEVFPRGLSLLAQLGVAKGLMEEARKSNTPAKRVKQAGDPKP